MVIEDILNKTGVYEIAEMTFLVEQYIKEKKGAEVDINLVKYIPTQDVNNPIFQMIYSEQVKMLHSAFNTAYSYYKNK